MQVLLKVVAYFPILTYYIISPQETWGWPNAGRRYPRNPMTDDQFHFTQRTFNSTNPFNLTIPVSFSKASNLLGNNDLSANLLNPFNFVTTLINQTKSTVPLLLNSGNFTVIQAALLWTIGCMAAGAAVVVLETLAFRERDSDIESHHHLQHGLRRVGSATYDLPPFPVYGTYDVPGTFAAEQDNSNRYIPANSEVIPTYADRANADAAHRTTLRKRRRDTRQISDLRAFKQV